MRNFGDDQVWVTGRLISVNDTHRASKLNLHDYRNAAGQPMKEVFTIEYRTN